MPNSTEIEIQRCFYLIEHFKRHALVHEYNNPNKATHTCAHTHTPLDPTAASINFWKASKKTVDADTVHLQYKQTGQSEQQNQSFN